NEDRRVVAVALRTELAGIARTLELNTDQLKIDPDDAIIPDIAHSVRVMPQLIPKLVSRI
ncbi:MAG: hypothetical protein WAK04_13835, partial [Xanthobacteraceae bacterium]